MITRVRLHDFSKYDPLNCHTGGSYSYSIQYFRVGPDAWDVEYSTSSDFEYWKYCGTFINNRTADGKCEICEDVQETVNTDRLIDEVKKWNAVAEIYGKIKFYTEYDTNSVESGNDSLLLKVLNS